LSTICGCSYSKCDELCLMNALVEITLGAAGYENAQESNISSMKRERL